MTRSDAQVIEAVRAAGGNVAAAARTLGLADSSIRARLGTLRRRDALPGDVAYLVVARSRPRSYQGVR